MTEKAKAELSGKVTDSGEIMRIWDSIPYYERQTARGLIYGKWDGEVAWPMREAARIQLGVYASTDILDEVNRNAPVFAHISREDKTLVAFTPDKAAGEADRQVRSSIGRLLARIYPMICENTLRDLVEQHQAEANPNVVFLEGLDIAKAYLNPESPSSCMRADKSSSEKAWTIGNIPALAYATAGVKLAVLLKQDGGIAARCLVVEVGDKKWRVRNYGSPALWKWLAANGYKETGGWQGVVFNTVPHPTMKNQYLMPYLDCNGGVTSSEHCSVALIDGKVTGLTKELRRMVSSVGATIAMPSTSCYVNLPVPFDTTAMQKTCAITGEKFKPWEEKAVKVYHEGSIKESCTRLLGSGYVYTCIAVYAKPEDTVEVFCSTYVNDVKILEDNGLARRSEKFYEDCQWAYARALVKTSAGDFVEKEDAVAFIALTSDGGQPVLQIRHKSEVPKGSTQLATVCGQKVYADKGVEIQRTDTKAKVHALTHDIKTLWDGTVSYSRGTRRTVIFGEEAFYKGGFTEAMREIVTSKVLKKKLPIGGTWSIRSLAHHLESEFSMSSLFVPEFRSLENLFPSTNRGYYDNSAWQQAATVEQLRTMTLACIQSEAKDAVRVWLDQIIAEMEAVEAPHYLQDAVSAAIPTPEIQILQPA